MNPDAGATPARSIMTGRPACILCGLAALILALAGIACWGVASLVVEGSEDFSITLGGHRFSLPGDGMLGDLGTYCAEWALMGLFLLGASVPMAATPWINDRIGRRIVIALTLLALGVAGLFANNLLL